MYVEEAINLDLRDVTEAVRRGSEEGGTKGKSREPRILKGNQGNQGSKNEKV